MKNTFLVTAFLMSSLGYASSLVPGFEAQVKNYGNQDLSQTQLVLHYDSHSGSDGTCASCVHQKYVLKITNDSKLIFPQIVLDSRNSRHSFTLQVSNSFDRWGQQIIYSCDVLNPQFEFCENVLSKDLKTISAYSFADRDLDLTLASGSSVQNWLLKINDMFMRVNVQMDKPLPGEEIAWNNQVFASCKVDKCKLHAGALFFAGQDYGSHPQFKYSVEATQSPDFYSIIKGVNQISLSDMWNYDLPKDLTKFKIDDK